jgi:stress response protein SCP2
LTDKITKPYIKEKKMDRQKLLSLVKETKRIPTDFDKGMDSTKPITQVESVVQLDNKLMTLGYRLSPELFFWAESLPKDNLQKLNRLIEVSLTSILGTDLKYFPFFANFGKDNFNLTERNIYDLFVSYGKYTHSYEEYCKDKEAFKENSLRNFSVFNLGKSFIEEVELQVKRLVESSIPLSENSLIFIKTFGAELSNESLERFNPSIKENAALLNKIKYERGLSSITCSTTTDLLRFIVAVNDGDVTLTKPTKFKNFPRKFRRTIFGLIEKLSKTNRSYVADAISYSEEWKRIGEKIHPHESKFDSVKHFFSETRGDTNTEHTVNSLLEKALSSGNKSSVLEFFQIYPSLLGRNLDRVLRSYPDIAPSEIKKHYKTFSSKVIISLIQHLKNRNSSERIFTNKKGEIFFTKNTNKDLESSRLNEVLSDLKGELKSRIKSYKEITVSKDLETVAIPTSDKLKPRGIGILPIGSETKLSDVDTLRFFIYWHQSSSRTDYDLSTIFLDKDFKVASQVSYTRLGNDFARHSGDITSAPNGASEFIDIKLAKISSDVKYIVPQVNVYAGEKFNVVKEVFFGFMERNESEKGLAFEPKTVKFKSELQGEYQLALPVIFIREDDGSWTAKWMHLGLNSYTSFMGQVERNSKNTSLLVKAIVKKNFFKVGELVDLYKEKQDKESKQDLFVYSELIETESAPETKFIGQANLQDLIPEKE